MNNLAGPPSTQTSEESRHPPAGDGHRSNAEMERLRHIILGETTEQMQEITRQVTNRDARVRRLMEDMPDAISKNATEHGSLTRLANALRAPIEEALTQSVQGDQHKLAEILAPALARALPRTLAEFLLGLPSALARRAWHVVCPWARPSGKKGAPPLSALARRAVAEHAFQVDRICLFQKETFEVLRTSDAGFDDEMVALEVDQLFVQLTEALRSGSPNPTAMLRYPRPRKKDDFQGIILLEGAHTTLAAYCTGRPAPWLHDRLQDLADEADGLASAINEESAAGQGVELRLQALDGLLKKGLVCYVPAPQPAAEEAGVRTSPWWEDAFVVACVIAIVWLVASVSRASSSWNKTVAELDREPGIVVTDRSWVPGRSITGLRDPLAPDPAELLKSHGYQPGSINLHFTSFLSDDAPFREQRESLKHAERDSVRREIASSYARALALMEASLEMHQNPVPAQDTGTPPGSETRETIRKELLRTLLELPSDANFDFKDGVVTIPSSLPKAVRTRIREVVKAIPWVKTVNEGTLPGRTTSMLPVGGVPAPGPVPAGQGIDAR
ncbi:MAG: hypothetical protein K1X78_24325 [Verrucomicrobiaceae bacterium]|nr:hypothetical protein [Verrucomicrobiaceae bacterium]